MKKPAYLIFVLSAILAVVFLGTSYLALYLSRVFYPLIYTDYEMGFMGGVLAGRGNRLIAPAFLVPIAIGIWYLWPLYRVFVEWSSSPDATLAKRRLLNAPVMLSLISFVGWVLALSGVAYGAYSQGAGFFSHVMAKVLGFGVAMMSLCIVLTYYFMEFMSRRFLIPIFFLDGKLSECEGAIALNIKVRFIIFYYSISVFPSLVFYGLVETITDRAGIPEFRLPALALIVSILLVGGFLTYLISTSYRIPLARMKNAAEKVRSGDYNVFVPVYSNDETGNLSEAINEMARGLKEKEFIKNTFGKMVDPRVRDHLLSGNVQLGGEVREATVLFADIRGFTPLSEEMPPAKIVMLLNRYFEIMSACIIEEKGLINSYIGDAIMAVFGAPLDQPDHPDAAVRAAAKMRGRMAELNAELIANNLPEIQMKIGIATGKVLAGNIGSRARMKYTVIGDTVNTAARLEKLCGDLKKEIIMSESTAENISDSHTPEKLATITVKGKQQPINVYCL